MNITKWKTLSSEVVLKANIFRYLKIKSESPTTGKSSDFDIVQCLNWVNVIAVTKDKKIILVKQYRHGTDEVTVEFPAGAVHVGEDVRLAAERELREETGYSTKNWQHLGRMAVNPAFMTNACDIYLALDVELTHEQEFDPFEEIEVYVKDVSELGEMVKSGEIKHSLVVAGLFLLHNSGVSIG